MQNKELPTLQNEVYEKYKGFIKQFKADCSHYYEKYNHLVDENILFKRGLNGGNVEIIVYVRTTDKTDERSVYDSNDLYLCYQFVTSKVATHPMVGIAAMEILNKHGLLTDFLKTLANILKKFKTTESAEITAHDLKEAGQFLQSCSDNMAVAGDPARLSERDHGVAAFDALTKILNKVS